MTGESSSVVTNCNLRDRRAKGKLSNCHRCDSYVGVVIRVGVVSVLCRTAADESQSTVADYQVNVQH